MPHSFEDLKNERRGLKGFKTIFHSIVFVGIYFAGVYLPSLIFARFYSMGDTYLPLFAIVCDSLLKIGITVLLGFFYISKVLKLPLSEFRVRKPNKIFIWIICGAALPLLLSLFFILFTPGVFASSELSDFDVCWTVLGAIFYCALAAGIVEEAVFRGMIMHILEIRFGKIIAVIAPSVLFALIHLVEMEEFNLTDLFLLTAAGTLAGVMFSLIAVQSRSIWPGAVVHGVWNLVIIGEIFQISVSPQWTSLFTYTLASDSVLLTGGAFGIESSLPAIFLYSAVILLLTKR